MLGIGAGEKVLYVELARFGVLGKIRQQQVELRWRHRLIVVPPQRLFGHRVANNKLVLDGASRMHARVDYQGAAGGEAALLVVNRQLDQLSFGKVACKRPRKG